MRDHIRREAGQYAEAAWWLVPIVFAVAALAAVAFNDGQGSDEPAQQVQSPAPAAAVPVRAAAQPQPAESTYEVTEHVQAF